MIPLILFLLFSAGSFAQTGVIKGKIVDAKTDEPLIGASVVIEGTTIGAAADLEGNFVIRNVPLGEHALIATYVAYLTDTIQGVRVEANEEITVQILLLPDDISLSEVEVIARANRESENILMMDRRQALVATQSVGAHELSRKGIGDAQAAVANVSGVSLQEGVKNVFVRGLGDRYNATLLNGFPIPSEDPEYKNIALEFFGTDIIQNIDVNKVFSGRNSSDVGGAIINIHSKELIGDRAFGAEVSEGVNSEAARVDFLRVDGSNLLGFAQTDHPAEGTFDFSNRLDPLKVSLPLNHGLVLSGGSRFRVGENGNPITFFAVASHSSEHSFTEEIVRSITTGDEDPYQDQVGNKHSRKTSQLALANVCYDINRSHALTYNFMMVHATNEYTGEYNGRDTEKNQDPPFGVYFRRQQINDNLLLTHQLISDWELLDNLELKAGISYNHIKGLEPDRRENYLYLTPERSYALMGSNRQKRFFSELIESDINVKASLTYRLRGRFGSDASAITFGYDGRLVDDAFESIEYNYDPYNPVPFQLNEVRLDEVYNPLTYADGRFRMTLGEPNTYRVSKYIHSGYAEGTYQLARDFTANVGFRLDHVDMTVEYVVDHASPGNESLDKKFYALPSLNLKYELNPKNTLRFGASKTYTLPQSKEISPYRYVNIGFASQGNADLKPSDNYNADLKWDCYMSPSELVSANLFYKRVINPIARIEVGNSAGVLKYDNISDFANVVGIELEVRKTLFDRSRTASGNASGKVNRLSMGLNGSYIFTEMEVDYIQGTTRESQLEGASPFIGNFDISYNVANNERNALISLVFTYISRRIHTIGMLGFKDIVGEGVATLDFVSSYRFKNHFTVKLKASNLLNPSYRLTRERSGSDKGEKVVLNDYKKGMNLSLGISYEL